MKKGNLGALIASVAAGRPLPEAAAGAGMSVSLAQRRLREPDVMCAVEEARVELNRQALGRFRALRDVAMDRLAVFLASDSEPVHLLRAIDLVLRHASAADTVSLQERMLDLERRIEGVVEDASGPPADDEECGDE
jgi:hypothetical protein